MGDKFVMLALAKDVKGLATVGCALSCVNMMTAGAIALTNVLVTAAANAAIQHVRDRRHPGYAEIHRSESQVKKTY